MTALPGPTSPRQTPGAKTSRSCCYGPFRAAAPSNRPSLRPRPLESLPALPPLRPNGPQASGPSALTARAKHDSLGPGPAAATVPGQLRPDRHRRPRATPPSAVRRTAPDRALRHDDLRGRQPGQHLSVSDSVALPERLASRVRYVRGERCQRVRQTSRAARRRNPPRSAI